MFSKVSATYYAKIAATNATADPLDAITVIETPVAPSHNIALSDLP